jgi:hypothetical protein
VAGVSATDGFSGGRATACLTSGFDVSGFDAFLASITLGFAATGCVVAVVSALAPKPTSAVSQTQLGRRIDPLFA